MRNLVNGILGKNESNATSPSLGQSKQGNQLPNIQRPNYQKEKIKQRLSPLANGSGSVSKGATQTLNRLSSNTVSAPSTNQMISSVLEKKPNQVPGSLVEKALSPLQKLSLSQSIGGKISAQASTDIAQFIGKTRDGSIVWFFPQLEESLASYLQMKEKKSDAVGIVAVSCFSPGQLFYIDEVMKEFPQLAYNTESCQTDEFPFVFRVVGSHAQEIQKVVKEIYLRLNRRVIQGVTSYFQPTPTRFLVQSLRLQNQEAVAVLDGINVFHGVGLMDRLFKQKRPSSLRFRIESNYLLIQGEQEVIKNMITSLKQEADRLIAD
jgi:hypothetical protein